MILQMDESIAARYKSPSQRSRVITEHWFETNMFCPGCTNDRLHKSPNNSPVVDIVCDQCGGEFQVKAKSAELRGRLRDAAYGPMMDRIRRGRSPHFAFLHYDPARWTIRTLMLIPGFFFTPSVIEQCKPLSPTARRAGWVGCNILAEAIPQDGRLLIVDHGRLMPVGDVRRNWARFSWLDQQDLESRGWTAEVLKVVRTFKTREFELGEVYAFEEELAKAFPGNRNVRPKIRQQLQVLRDRGILRFLGRGRYIATPE